VIVLHRGIPRVLAQAAVALGAVITVVATSASASATTGRIDQATPMPDGTLSVVFSAIGLAPGERIDLTSVIATIDGKIVSAKAKSIASDTAAPLRSTVLTIDVSGSMRAKTPDGTTRMEAAKAAANAYLAAVPKDVHVGLVTFSDAAAVIVAPTTDRATVRSAVDALVATNGNTALYDAILLANKALGTTGVRNQLLISDGANDSGTATLAQAGKSLAANQIVLDAVSIDATANQLSDMNVLTKAGGGLTVTVTQAAQLTSTFAAAAQSQATAIIITVTVPPAVAGTSKTVTIAANAGSSAIGDSILAILPALPTITPTPDPTSYGAVAVPASQPGVMNEPWFLPSAVGVLGIGIFGLLAVAILTSDRHNQQAGRVNRRLSKYSVAQRGGSTSPSIASSGALGQSQVARSAVELAGRIVQSRDLDNNLGAKLEAAGVPLRPGEWMLVHVGLTIGLGLVFALMSGFTIVATILGLAIGIVVPYIYLVIKEGRRKAGFAAQLPDTLTLLAGSIASGYSLPQAIDTVVRESDAPMSVELNRAIVEARLGVTMEDALETVALRMESLDFGWVVMAVRIQREVGGNLAEVLTSVAATMRERERLRRQVSVLSAEGRLSAVILGALPLLFTVYLVLVRPEYIGTLTTSPLGIALILGGVFMFVAGTFWLRKVVKVEV